MSTSFGALCSDFYVNLALGFKLPFETRRDSILTYFDRIRSQLPDMAKFRSYGNEMSIESQNKDGEHRWMSLQKQEIRCGHVNPSTMNDAYHLHEIMLSTAPYYITHSLMDMDFLELLYGFDLECKANQNEIVADALYENSPLGALAGLSDAKPLDIEPAITMAIGDHCEYQASFEVKTRTTSGQVRRGKYRNEPISVFLSLRRASNPESPEVLLNWFKEMNQLGERLCSDHLIPHLLTPISQQIIGSPDM